MKQTIFVTGIDTDAGKSYVTGWLARELMDEGKSVITLKPVQTGNAEFSEDIEVHRRIMGVGMLPRDLDHTTAPIIFSYPASPHLAAQIDGATIDPAVIDSAIQRLHEEYDVVLVEGAGGLMVPLTDEMLTIDFAHRRDMPVVLVTNGKLGSINHTLLSLEALKSRGMKLQTLAYNTYFDNDKVIAADTRAYLQRHLSEYFPEARYVEAPAL